MNSKKLFRCILAAALGILPAVCRGDSPTSLAINLDPCVAKVEITLKQGDVSKTAPSDNPGSASFDGFDWTKDMTVKITVREMKSTPACEGAKIAKGDSYYLKGMIPSPGGAFTLAATDLPNLYRPNDVPKDGTVYGGRCDVPKYGPGIALGVDLDTAHGNCQKICWEQWIKPQLYWLGTAPPTEIMSGKRFSDPAGHTPHNYGNWVSPSLPRCPGVSGTRWLDDGVVGRGSNGEGLLGEAMKEQPAGL